MVMKILKKPAQFWNKVVFTDEVQFRSANDEFFCVFHSKTPYFNRKMTSISRMTQSRVLGRTQFQEQQNIHQVLKHQQLPIPVYTAGIFRKVKMPQFTKRKKLQI